MQLPSYTPFFTSELPMQITHGTVINIRRILDKHCFALTTKNDGVVWGISLSKVVARRSGFVLCENGSVYSRFSCLVQRQLAFFLLWFFPVLIMWLFKIMVKIKDEKKPWPQTYWKNEIRNHTPAAEHSV